MPLSPFRGHLSYSLMIKMDTDVVLGQRPIITMLYIQCNRSATTVGQSRVPFRVNAVIKTAISDLYEGRTRKKKDDEQQVTRYARYQIYPAEHARRKLDQKSAAVAVERKK